MKKIHRRRRTAGFSLLELVTVIAIIGIIVAAALPALWRYVSKSRRTEAKLALVDMDKLQRVYYMEHNRYASNVKDLGFKLDHGSFLNNNVYKGKYYRYITQTTDDGGQSYTGYATGNIDHDGFDDLLFVRRATRP